MRLWRDLPSRQMRLRRRWFSSLPLVAHVGICGRIRVSETVYRTPFGATGLLGTTPPYSVGWGTRFGGIVRRLQVLRFAQDDIQGDSLTPQVAS
jgi:hypothetical protein